jgi:hypothetical protein
VKNFFTINARTEVEGFFDHHNEMVLKSGTRGITAKPSPPVLLTCCSHCQFSS